MRAISPLRALSGAARVVLLFAGLAAGCLPAVAGHRVILASGNHLDAVDFRIDRDLIVLSLPGGGEIGIPSRNIVRIDKRDLPPEEAVPETMKGAVPAPPIGPSLLAPPRPRVSPWDPEPGVRLLIQEIAGAQKVDPKLVEAMVKVESNYDPYAVSYKGATGLMQLMPETVRRFQVGNTFDPAQNLEGGTRYIKELLDRYGEIRLALAAYNAGEEAVDRYRGIPPFRETQTYVVRILRLLNP